MGDLFSTWSQFARSTAEGGFLVALSSVCLLHYFVQLYRLQRERHANALALQAISGLKHELKSTQNVCDVAMAESELLRQILAGGSPELITKLILQQFVPDPEHGWAVYIDLSLEPHVTIARGLTEPPSSVIDINDEYIGPCWMGYPVTFSQPRIAKSPFLLNFSQVDRRRSEQLYVLGVRAADRVCGLVVTTSLFPQNVALEQQLELARRLCSGLARHITASESQAFQIRELKNSTDRLAIRTLLDQTFENPQRMTQQLLRTMQLLLEADRGVMFLSTSLANWEATSYVTSGSIPPAEIREQWQRSEEQLAKLSNGWSDRILFDEFSLEMLDLNHSFKSALVVPVVIKSKSIGTLVFTRVTKTPFTEVQQNLVLWAAELLSTKMSYAIHHAEIKRMAQLDAVTQISNRHTFDEELERELQIAYATSSELSLILFDLDRFKSVNDTYGHQAGDEVLRAMGQILRDSLSHLRAGDRAICARYGGEEFAVILPGVGPLGTARIAEVIRTHVEKTKVKWQQQVIAITVSGGIATYPENGETAESLISAADSSLYQAKKQGRNRIGSPETHLAVLEPAMESMRLETEEPEVVPAAG